jgi:hypothetical protein
MADPPHQNCKAILVGEISPNFAQQNLAVCARFRSNSIPAHHCHCEPREAGRSNLNSDQSEARPGRRPPLTEDFMSEEMPRPPDEATRPATGRVLAPYMLQHALYLRSEAMNGTGARPHPPQPATYLNSRGFGVCRALTKTEAGMQNFPAPKFCLPIKERTVDFWASFTHTA